MVKITGVEANSLAERAGVIGGDILISINKNEICDVLDYRFYLTERSVLLVLLRDGKEYEIRIKKGEYEDIGLEFETFLIPASKLFSIQSVPILNKILYTNILFSA